MGTVLPFQLRLTQTAGTASGSVLLGQVSYDMNVAIFDSRRFVGGGSSTYTDDDITFIERIGTRRDQQRGGTIGLNGPHH